MHEMTDDTKKTLEYLTEYFTTSCGTTISIRRLHAQLIIISYHFAGFYLWLCLWHTSIGCVFIVSFRLFSTQWHDEIMCAFEQITDEWVNERRKEAANYIDKHQLCSKPITWLWKIELIDAAQHRVFAHPCKCDVRRTVCSMFNVHTHRLAVL